MVTISDNDLKQLLLYIQAMDGRVQKAHNSTRLCNRIRLGKNTAQILMKFDDVHRIISNWKGVIVANK